MKFQIDSVFLQLGFDLLQVLGRPYLQLLLDGHPDTTQCAPKFSSADFGDPQLCRPSSLGACFCRHQAKRGDQAFKSSQKFLRRSAYESPRFASCFLHVFELVA
ncbi:hypothetical protein D3C85_1325570 [compost metagenome]